MLQASLILICFLSSFGTMMTQNPRISMGFVAIQTLVISFLLYQNNALWLSCFILMLFFSLLFFLALTHHLTFSQKIFSFKLKRNYWVNGSLLIFSIYLGTQLVKVFLPFLHEPFDFSKNISLPEELDVLLVFGFLTLPLVATLCFRFSSFVKRGRDA